MKKLILTCLGIGVLMAALWLWLWVCGCEFMTQDVDQFYNGEYEDDHAE